MATNINTLSTVSTVDNAPNDQGSYVIIDLVRNHAERTCLLWL